MRCASKESLDAPPCYRYLQIVDIALFRTQTDVTIWTKAKLGLDDTIINRVTSWVPWGESIAELTQGHGTILRLHIRQFDPSTIDFANLSDAEKHTYEHPWGVTDLKQAEADIRNFIRTSAGYYIRSKTTSDDEISRGFFSALHEYTRISSLDVCYM